MKKFKFFLLAAAGCFVLACDDTEGDDNSRSEVAGTYNLTAFNAPMSVDFDADGTSSSNLLNESDCFDNSKLVLNADGTFTLTDNAVTINGTTASCGSQTTTGIWGRSGNTLTTGSGPGNGVMTNYMYVSESGSSSATITRTIADGNYPSLNGSGDPQWSVGTVNMVYTKGN
jgi:hypothetical protein